MNTPAARVIPRLDRADTTLLVVDVQEKLLPAMLNPERLLQRCTFAARLASLFNLPTIVTEQYVRGLGHTIPSLRSAFPPGTLTFEKTRFSACIAPAVEALATSNRRTILICGIEAHVCVLQSALDLCAAGFSVFVLSDAVSSGEPDQIAHAFGRMASAGACITGCVSAAYELARDASDPAFRDLLTLVKPIRLPIVP